MNTQPPDTPPVGAADHDLPLTWLEVLDDERQALSGAGTVEHSDARIAFVNERKRCSGACADPEKDLLYEAARTAFRKELIQKLHDGGRSALCFSGGGIRSATFGLGIMQGLAAHSERNDKDRPKLLGEFDYLSTVSGGGYLGAWFSSWAARRTGATRDGAAEAIRRLSDVPETDFDREPAEVRHLRKYSNYLMPKLGLLSGDTLAALANVVRNMFLNWLVLLPLLAAVLLIPLLSARVVTALNMSEDTKWYLVVSGLIFGVIGTAYVGYDLPSAGDARNRYKWYLWFCLGPLTVSAVHLSTFWAWMPAASQPGATYWDLVKLGRDGIEWWHFGGFGAVMHGVGMLLGLLLAMIVFHRPPKKIGLAATLLAVATGFAGGVLAWLFARACDIHPAGGPVRPELYAVLAFPTVLAAFLFAGTLLVGGSSYFTRDPDREWWARSGGWMMILALAWLVGAAVVIYSSYVVSWLNVQMSAAFTALTGATGWAAAKLGKDPDTPSGRRESKDGGGLEKLTGLPWVKQAASKLMLPAFLLLLVILLSAINHALLNLIAGSNFMQPRWPEWIAPLGNATAHVWWLALMYALICVPAWLCINVNTFSLHAMYRQRLIRGYLGASNEKRNPHPFIGFDDTDDLLMRDLSPHRPLHVMNMALNLVGGDNLAWQQRKASSFTCTRLHTGGCRVGYRKSAEYGGAYAPNKRPISLGTAMTISGAAASPNMGYHSLPLLTMVMTLFNARLGWWLGNPNDASDVWKKPGPNWGVRPFLDEAFGYTDDKNAWIYLSDGGHFENLGVYEMVMRRCKLIVVSDAGADPAFHYEDLGNAVRKIRVDLGIPIEFPGPMPMWPAGKSSRKLSGEHCAVGTIRYKVVDGDAAPDGVIIYIKPSLNGDEPADVTHYASTDPRFPHQPTPDQFFSEAQFESYRRLGLHIVEEICGPEKKDLNGFTHAVRDYVGSRQKAGAKPRAAGLSVRPVVH